MKKSKFSEEQIVGDEKWDAVATLEHHLRRSRDAESIRSCETMGSLPESRPVGRHSTPPREPLADRFLPRAVLRLDQPPAVRGH